MGSIAKIQLNQSFSTFFVPWPISNSNKSLWLSLLSWPTFSVCRGPLQGVTYFCGPLWLRLWCNDDKVAGISVRTHDSEGDLQKEIALPSAEDDQSTAGIGVDLQGKIRSLCLQFMGTGPYGCSYAPVFLNFIRLANPLLKLPNVCGPPDLRAVAHRLTCCGPVS